MSSKSKIIKKKRKLEEKYMFPRLTRNFYDTACIELAKSLLGKILARKLNDGTILRGIIVETESYPGGEDKASNSYNGRKTEKNLPLYMVPGTAFIYMTYGMYHCFNVSSREPGGGVLLRALQPLEGHNNMTGFRNKKCKTEKTFKERELCNGPSKLCMSFNITKEQNKLDLCSEDNEEMWIEEPKEKIEDIQIVETSRIGIDSAGSEWAKKPLRFYIYNNENVSKNDKIAEQKFNSD